VLQVRQGQARFGGDNSYDASAEPSYTDWLAQTTVADAEKKVVTTRILVDMIRPAFPKNMSNANIGAMLKRCTVCLNTENIFYVRLAGLDSVVERHPLLGGYLEESKGKILDAWRKTSAQRDPEDYAQTLAFETRIVAELLPSVATAAEGPAAAEPAEAAEAFDDVDPFGFGAQGLDGEPQLEEELEQVMEDELAAGLDNLLNAPDAAEAAAAMAGPSTAPAAADAASDPPDATAPPPPAPPAAPEPSTADPARPVKNEPKVKHEIKAKRELVPEEERAA